MKHTPGNWEVGYGSGLTGPRTSPTVYLDEHDISEIPIRVGDRAIAWVLSSRDMLDGRELADAQVIAAAPDMLKALYVARERAHAGDKYAARIIEAAIHKATGESQ